MSEYKRSVTVDTLLTRVIRILRGYTDGEAPSVAQMESARFVLNGYLDSLEETGTRFFLRENRQYVFSESSIVFEAGKYYRCITSFTAPTVTTHATSTAYSLGDNVYPSVYNGFRYVSQNIGTSSGSAPTFPESQNETVVDNDITWLAVPDERPAVGGNWRAFFMEDSTQTSGSAYSAGSYTKAGTFTLQDDEASIESAFIRYDNTDTPLTIFSELEYSKIESKNTIGVPLGLYLVKNGSVTTANIYPIPEKVGVDGYVLHYTARLRAKNYTGSTVLDMPDTWITSVIYNVADRLSDEYSLPIDERILISKRAEKYEKGTRSLDIPATSSGVNIVMGGY